ncbi:MAG: hypothetical protein FWC34_00650, partial [Bacteroidetes bacterium]|nr:hypothetical protein [Bacteroidota bacterium]
MKSILFLVTALFLAINVNAQTQREFLGYNGARIDHNWIWQGLNFDSETMTASVRVWHRTVGSHTGSGFYGGDIAIIGIVVPREIENPANGQMYTVTRWVRGGQIGRDRHFVVNQQIAAHVESFMNFHVFIPNTIEVIEGEHADFNSVFRRGRVVNNNWVVTHA